MSGRTTTITPSTRAPARRDAPPKGRPGSVPSFTVRPVTALRISGGVLVLIAIYGSLAILSPDGAATGALAQALEQTGGWLTVPWCVLLGAVGATIALGDNAWRRQVIMRLIGGFGFLLGVGTLGASSPAGIASSSITADASGALGTVTWSTLSVSVGSAGAIATALVLATASAVLLLGIPRPYWESLGRHLLAGSIATGRYTAFALVWATTHFGRALLALVGITFRTISNLVVNGNPASPIRTDEPEPDAARHPSPGRSQDQDETATSPRGRRNPSVSPISLGDTGPRSLIIQTGNQSGRPDACVRPTPAVPSTRSVLDPAPWPERWRLPPLSLLSVSVAQQMGDNEIAEKAATIEKTLLSFNIPVTVREARVGPTVTQFSLVPGDGVPVKTIKRYEYDLQLRLAAKTLRIELPVPGRPFVGIEIPNDRAASVGLREVLETREFTESKGRLRVALGRDVDGRPRVGDLARMPHLLIAGQTGAGKSVCVNTIIASLLSHCRPDELNLLMIDPKQVELAEYEGIPHLRYPVVTDLAEAGKVLLWACEEMERRYTLLSKAGYRHLDAYNRAIEANAEDATPSSGNGRHEAWTALTRPKPLPYIVLIIDELADLMMFAPDDVEPAICRLTAKARAVGIHLVVATQRPSVNVVTGLIKANIPSRIAFAVASQTDSRVILDTGGAEALLGRGDMLYLPYDQGRPVRVQGAWVSDEELSNIVQFWKDQGRPNYVSKGEIDALSLRDEEAASEKQDRASALLDRAVEVLRTSNHVSVSFLQRKLGIGYPKAAKLMDDLEDAGYVELDEATGKSYRVIAGDDPALPLDEELGVGAHPPHVSS
ncbi:MAG: DNA translocase FtsK [Chloroflexi bacterium]|nr:DNA translocase FtsK [Chloroflexota bacterium]